MVSCYCDFVEWVGFVCVLGEGLLDELVFGVCGVVLVLDDLLFGEWDVVVVSLYFSVVLFAMDFGCDFGSDFGSLRFDLDCIFCYFFIYDWLVVEEVVWCLLVWVVFVSVVFVMV